MRTAVAAVAAAMLWGAAALAQEVDPGADGAAGADGIDPRPLADLSARLGYNSARGPVLGLGARTDRLLGDQTLRFDVEAGEDVLRYGLSWTAPDLLGGTPAFGVAVDATRTDAGDVFGFETSVLRVTPALTWRLEDGRTARAYATASTAEVDGVAPDASALIRADRGDRLLVAAGAELAGRRVAGSTALRWSVGAELGGTDRDHDYLKLSGRVAAARPAWDDRLRMSARLSGGHLESLSGTSHVGDRYVLGAASLRGFAFGGFGPRDLAAPDEPALGGNSFAVARLDLRAPGLAPADVRVVPGAFLDMGALWGLDDTGGGVGGDVAVDDDARLRASIGLSLEIGTRIGPISLNLARTLADEPHDRTQPVSLSFERRF